VRRKSNSWHDAICDQLRAADHPLRPRQIWQHLQTAHFAHESKMPGRTLGARIYELTQLRKIERVRRGLYQLAGGAS
jgi:hypothetical protein